MADDHNARIVEYGIVYTCGMGRPVECTANLHDRFLTCGLVPLVLNCLAQHREWLTVLDLGSNALDDPGIELLTPGLESFRSLKRLDLSRNGMQLVAAPRFLAYITECTTLESLGLGHTYLCSDAVSRICRSLRHNTCWRNLDLENLRLQGSQIADLCHDLRCNTTLTTLLLGENKVYDTDCMIIAQLLRTNNTLTALSLNPSEHDDFGARHLALALLESNTTLTDLDLNGRACTWEADTVDAFLNLLDHNVWLDHCGMPPASERRRFYSVLENNRERLTSRLSRCRSVASAFLCVKRVCALRHVRDNHTDVFRLIAGHVWSSRLAAEWEDGRLTARAQVVRKCSETDGERLMREERERQREREWHEEALDNDSVQELGRVHSRPGTYERRVAAKLRSLLLLLSDSFLGTRRGLHWTKWF